MYLFEASAMLPDGRMVGNRSIICANDYLLTQKRTPTTVIVRLAKMSDATSVADVTIRAVTEENIELARAVTDNNGMAQFPKDPLFPRSYDPKAKDAHLFIADTATGPALVRTTWSRVVASTRSAATRMSSSVQLFKIRPNLLPE